MIRIAVVGAGYGGYGLAPAFQLAGADVVGLVAPSPTRRDQAAATLGISHTAPDLRTLASTVAFDAVAIAVPPSAQPSLATWSLERGLPVFAEKPLGTTVEEAEALADLAERKKTPTAVDFLFPELPAWRAAREMIDDGVIGKLARASVDWRFMSFDHLHGKVGWKTAKRDGGGALRHFGTHSLYYLEWLCGQITEISGGVVQPEGQEGDTLTHFSGVTERGVEISATISNNDLEGKGHLVRLYGSRGTLSLVNSGTNPVAFTLEHDGRVLPQLPVDRLTDTATRAGHLDPRVAPIASIARRFLAAIVGGPAVKPCFADGLRVQRLVQAVESGRGQCT